MEQIESLPFDRELERYLSRIKCQLKFARFGVKSGEVLAERLNAALAVTMVQAVSELSATWTDVPDARDVDYQDFWLKKVWDVSADGRSKSSCSMTSFRFALYDPPYGGATDSQIKEVEPVLFQILFDTVAPENCYRIFAVDTKCSKYFINEWWDYLWVAAHRERPEVIVIYGTATD